MKKFLSVLVCISFLSAAINAEVKNEKNYEISNVVLKYARQNSEYPDISKLNFLTVSLKEINGVYVSANSKEGNECKVNLLRFVRNSCFDIGAINDMLAAVVKKLNSEGFDGVYVLPDQSQIDIRTGEDKRSKDDKSLNFVIWIAQVSDVRTVAKGTRIDSSEDAIENPKHSRILSNSPVSDKTDDKVCSLNSEKISDYLRRLNRHPNRRVDSSVASSYNTGDVDVDYLVNERKPWLVYAQVSNTGTESTGDYRYRFGYINYQATGNDDIFSIDYIDSFEYTRAGMASYQIPILFPDYLKFRIYGSISDYTARDVGYSFMQYRGTNYIGGAEFVASPFSIPMGFALDFVAGFRYENIYVNNETLADAASGYMLIPYIGVSLDRRTPLSTTYFSLTAETNASDLDRNQMNTWGRLVADDNYVALKGDFIQSFYIEPLIMGDKFYDTTDWRNSIFANEIYMRARGQWVPDNKRLVPQQEFIGGGLYSVRGYPESIAAADNGFVLSMEYRLHFPRLLAPLSALDDKSKLFEDFNIRAPNPLSFADWDFMMRLFFDYGHFYNNNRQFYEHNLELMSTGVGLECQIMSNLNARIDCGWILNGLDKFRLGPNYNNVSVGDYKINFVITLSY